ncbi:unnamed protein product [Parajaminaea phylloscopi]
MDMRERPLIVATSASQRPQTAQINGIPLVHVSRLPDRYRQVFPFPVFNAIQSACFSAVAESDDNVVVSAPTGSGKGDTEHFDSSKARDITLFVTTPEKWDGLTRNWSAHRRCLQNVRLCMIDEIHGLREPTRGATLEIVVARMQTLGHGIRVLGVSATVPNIEDVAQWIGRACTDRRGPTPDLPAHTFAFGEEYRPCPLEKFVIGYDSTGDEWSAQKHLDTQLSAIIEQYAADKPTLVFVPTRKGAQQAAQALITERERRRGSTAADQIPPQAPADTSASRALQAECRSGVAFHHAGLSMDDRRYVENAFSEGKIDVLCCTTTLAVGVNLPAYCIIIKGTKRFENGAWTELSELDIIQMLGRAGRPQFGRKGVAVVMTEQAKRDHYVSLTAGRTVIESTLHHDLVEHINSEIGLRNHSTVEDLEQWLRGTFFFVRMSKNPEYYGIEGDIRAGASPEIRLRQLFREALARLDHHAFYIKSADGTLDSTDLGEILSRYYLSFETMLRLLQIEQADVKTLLEHICCATEFSNVRLRAGEKAAYGMLLKRAEIRFPIAAVKTVADKINIVIQATLARLNCQQAFKTGDHTANPALDKVEIFRHGRRIIKAAVDVALVKRDARTAESALELLRCFYAEAWDHSEGTLTQLEGIGDKSSTVLYQSGLRTYMDVAAAPPERLQLLLGRHPPFGHSLAQDAKSLPHFAICIHQLQVERGDVDVVVVRIKVGVGLCNTQPGRTRTKSRAGSPLFLNVLTISSDHATLFDVRRMPIAMLVSAHQGTSSATPKTFRLECRLTHKSQRIVVSACCDEIAGSEARAELALDDAAKEWLPSGAPPSPNLPATQRGASVEVEGLEDCPELFTQADDECAAPLSDDTAYLLPRAEEAAPPATGPSSKPSKLKSGQQRTMSSRRKTSRQRQIACEGDAVLRNLRSILAKTKAAASGQGNRRVAESAGTDAVTGKHSHPAAAEQNFDWSSEEQHPVQSCNRGPVQDRLDSKRTTASLRKQTSKPSRRPQASKGRARNRARDAQGAQRVVDDDASSGSTPPLPRTKDLLFRKTTPSGDEDESALEEQAELRLEEWKRRTALRSNVWRRTRAALQPSAAEAVPDHAIPGSCGDDFAAASQPNAAAGNRDSSGEEDDDLLEVSFPIRVIDEEADQDAQIGGDVSSVKQARVESPSDDAGGKGHVSRQSTFGDDFPGRRALPPSWLEENVATIASSQPSSHGHSSDPVPTNTIVIEGSEDESMPASGTTLTKVAANIAVCDAVERILQDDDELDAWLEEYTVLE